MNLKHLLLTIAALGALVSVTSCDYEAPKIEYKQTITNDYSDVVKVLQNQTATISEKLAAIETAMSNQTISLEQKLDLLKQAVDNQSLTLSQKIELLTSAVNNGVIKYAEMSQKIIDAIDAMSASNAEKLAAIEKSVNDQTVDLSAKLALIEAAVQKGFADTVEAMGLVEDAITSLEGALEDKLQAIENAINDQKVELSAKLVLIQGAVEAGFADNVEAINMVEDAIASLEGTMEEKLEAIEDAIDNQTVKLSKKLVLVQRAIKAGFVDNVNAIGYVEDAVTSLEGTLEEKLEDIEDALDDQTVKLSTKLNLISSTVKAGFADNVKAIGYVQKAIKSLEGTMEDKLEDIEDAIDDQTVDLSAKLKLIKAAVKSGFADNAKAIGYVKKAISSLDGTVEKKLDAITKVINDQTENLTDKLDLIDGTLETELGNIEDAQGLIKKAVKSLKGDYSKALKQIKEAVESMTTKLETKLGAIKTSVDEGIISIKEGQELIAAAIEKASADSVTSGLNKDQILDLDLTKGCAILTLDFWKSIYNKTTSNDYKSVSDLLNATLPIPETAEIMFNYYSKYPSVEAPSQVFITCVSDCTVTPDLTSTPKLMAANTDSDFVESKLSAYGYDLENIMKYARNFVFSYDEREACAVYKVNHMVNISCTIDYNYVAGFSNFTIKAVGFGSQYCSDNNAYKYSRNLYYVYDTTPTFNVVSGAETVSFKADLVGNALLNDKNKIVKSSYDTPLGYLFTYTDYRKAGEPLKIEAIINY